MFRSGASRLVPCGCRGPQAVRHSTSPDPLSTGPVGVPGAAAPGGEFGAVGAAVGAKGVVGVLVAPSVVAVAAPCCSALRLRRSRASRWCSLALEGQGVLEPGPGGFDPSHPLRPGDEEVDIAFAGGQQFGGLVADRGLATGHQGAATRTHSLRPRQRDPGSGRLHGLVRRSGAAVPLSSPARTGPGCGSGLGRSPAEREELLGKTSLGGLFLLVSCLPTPEFRPCRSEIRPARSEIRLT